MAANVYAGIISAEYRRHAEVSVTTNGSANSPTNRIAVTLIGWSAARQSILEVRPVQLLLRHRKRRSDIGRSRRTASELRLQGCDLNQI
jgi:hypothetical protein